MSVTTEVKQEVKQEEKQEENTLAFAEGLHKELMENHVNDIYGRISRPFIKRMIECKLTFASIKKVLDKKTREDRNAAKRQVSKVLGDIDLYDEDQRYVTELIIDFIQYKKLKELEKVVKKIKVAVSSDIELPLFDGLYYYLLARNFANGRRNQTISSILKKVAKHRNNNTLLVPSVITRLIYNYLDERVIFYLAEGVGKVIVENNITVDENGITEMDKFYKSELHFRHRLNSISCIGIEKWTEKTLDKDKKLVDAIWYNEKEKNKKKRSCQTKMVLEKHTKRDYYETRLFESENFVLDEENKAIFVKTAQKYDIKGYARLTNIEGMDKVTYKIILQGRGGQLDAFIKELDLHDVLAESDPQIIINESKPILFGRWFKNFLYLIDENCKEKVNYTINEYHGNYNNNDNDNDNDNDDDENDIVVLHEADQDDEDDEKDDEKNDIIINDAASQINFNNNINNNNNNKSNLIVLVSDKPCTFGSRYLTNFPTDVFEEFRSAVDTKSDTTDLSAKSDSDRLLANRKLKKTIQDLLSNQ